LLDHGETDGLKEDTSCLEKESSQDKLDLTERGNDDTNDNEGYVEKELVVWLIRAQNPTCKQNGYRGGGLVSQVSVLLWMAKL